MNQENLPSTPSLRLLRQMAEVARRSFPATPFVLLGNSPFQPDAEGGVFALPHSVLLCLVGPVEWSAVMWVVAPGGDSPLEERDRRLMLMEGRETLRRLLHPESDDPRQSAARASLEAAVRKALLNDNPSETPQVIIEEPGSLGMWLEAWRQGADAGRACGVEWVEVRGEKIVGISGLLGTVEEYAAAVKAL
jgi:hypothetical protein